MSNRMPFVVGNWKMYKTITEARSLLTSLRGELEGVDEVEVGVAPPFPALSAAAEVLGKSGIVLAAQNMHQEEEGAFTGEVSAPMLIDAGVRYVILGHSERRTLFGEDDDLVARKLRAAVDHDLVPILCVGETRDEREADRTVTVVTNQLRGSLGELRSHEAAKLVIAYEPVWAIGTGLTATPEQAQQVHAIIRDFLADLLGDGVATGVRIQYGGSVKPGNAAELMSQPDIDGALVGGASLDADSFVAIVRGAVAG